MKGNVGSEALIRVLSFILSTVYLLVYILLSADYFLGMHFPLGNIRREHHFICVAGETERQTESRETNRKSEAASCLDTSKVCGSSLDAVGTVTILEALM